jgi:hypothetical protein
VTARSNAADMSGLSTMLGRLAHQYPKLAAQRAGAEMFGAPRLNAFALFQPNEVKLSRVIADLFDPSGSHGQDTLFLNSLLNALGLPRVGATDHTTVRREMVTRAGRQIDLVIETPQIILGIENKPWASQSSDQLADYLAALKLWARGRKPVLVFLSNSEPETARDEVRVVRLHSADDDEISLHRVLLVSRDAIKAHRARIHIDEMMEYLSTEFGDTALVAKSDLPFVEAVEAEYERGAEGRRALAMTLISASSLHQRIIGEIEDGLLKACADDTADIVTEFDEWSLFDALSVKSDHWGLRRTSWPQNCSIALGAGRTNFGEVYFGVRAPVKKKGVTDAAEACTLRPAIADALSDIEGGRADAWWPWWKYAEPASWTAESLGSLILQSPTGNVIDHPAIKDLFDKLQALVRVVDRAVADGR